MKKSILFLFLTFSIYAFPQNNMQLFNLQSQNSIKSLQDRIKNIKEFQTSNICSEINYGQTTLLPIFNQYSLIDRYDSTYRWQWDKIIKNWKYNS